MNKVATNSVLDRFCVCLCFLKHMSALCWLSQASSYIKSRVGYKLGPDVPLRTTRNQLEVCCVFEFLKYTWIMDIFVSLLTLVKLIDGVADPITYGCFSTIAIHLFMRCHHLFRSRRCISLHFVLSVGSWIYSIVGRLRKTIVLKNEWHRW